MFFGNREGGDIKGLGDLATMTLLSTTNKYNERTEILKHTFVEYHVPKANYYKVCAIVWSSVR